MKNEEIAKYLRSIDDSLKTITYIQSAQLSLNQQSMKKMTNTTKNLLSSFNSALSHFDDNLDDQNEVPSDALVSDDKLNTRNVNLS